LLFKFAKEISLAMDIGSAPFFQRKIEFQQVLMKHQQTNG